MDDDVFPLLPLPRVVYPGTVVKIQLVQPTSLSLAKALNESMSGGRQIVITTEAPAHSDESSPSPLEDTVALADRSLYRTACLASVVRILRVASVSTDPELHKP